MTPEQLRGTNIGSVATLNKMLRWGWCDSSGRAKEWWSNQGPRHDENFAEEKDRKPGKKKFTKEKERETR